MSWVKKLQQLISGANSKTGMRSEQSEWSRDSKKSVEVTVETDEVFLLDRISPTHSGPVTTEPNEENRHGSPPAGAEP